MHVTRLVGQLAKLVRKYKGKFILSRDCRKLLDEQGLAGVYPRLLRTYCKQFNWGYQDGYPDIDVIQSSFLFTLYLLDLCGDEWRPSSFYEDRFLRAFPQALRQVPQTSFSTPEQTMRRCYSCRCLRRFAGFMGLAEIQSDRWYDPEFNIRKLPLLSRAVVFHLGRT